jgi:hypothetical protein
MQNNAQLVLKDQTELAVMATSTPSRINVRIGKSFADFQEYAEKLTKENLAAYQIKMDGTELAAGKYMEVAAIYFVPEDDGYLIHMDLDPRDPYDIMTELLEAQKTQEEAIEDIGAVIAEIAGG